MTGDPQDLSLTVVVAKSTRVAGAWAHSMSVTSSTFTETNHTHIVNRPLVWVLTGGLVFKQREEEVFA